MKFRFKCSEIAEIVGANYEGESQKELIGVNRIQDAKESEISFLSDPKFMEFAKNPSAGCLLVPRDFPVPENSSCCYIHCENPYESFAKLLQHIDKKTNESKKGIHESAIVADSADVHLTSFIGANCFIGENVRIAENTRIDANCVIEDDSEIGENTLIHSSAVICSGTVIGKNCIIHSGAVVGADGFGYLDRKDGSLEKIPQLGNVHVGDNVEIGANTTIDRALVGSTKICDGVKLDNLIHVAHNCEIGENTGIAAQAGISGSTKIGKRNRIAGQVGVVGHIYTAEDVVLSAQSGVSKSVTEKGIYFGSPIKDKRTAFRIEAVLRNLPELFRDVQELKRKLIDK